MPALWPGNYIQPTIMQQSIDHNELDALLRDCDSNWNAAQAHGLLCARLAVLGQDGIAGWSSQVLAESGIHNKVCEECASQLESLASTTSHQLISRGSEFELLLPDDEDPAAIRALAMGFWCEGFLHGLVAEKNNEVLKKRLAADPLADIIRDMLEITRAAAGDEADSEETEKAYFELVEYLRVAVQLVYEELADFRKPADPGELDVTETIH